MFELHVFHKPLDKNLINLKMFKPRLAAQKQFKKDNKIELEIEEP